MGQSVTSGASKLLALLLLAAVVAACGTPVGVRRVDPQTVHRELTANALSVGTASAPTVQVLHRLGLFERFRREPDTVLAELHAGLAATGDEDRLFALAELSFLHAKRSREREDLLAAAAYSYAFLFPGEDGTPPEPLDPRLRTAGDLYNRALTGSFFDPGTRRVVLDGGTFEVPFGSVEVEKARPVFDWAGWALGDFISAADLQVRGLRNRYRQRGIGAPLSAGISYEVVGDQPPLGHERIPKSIRVPVTALLRFDRPRAGLAGGRLRATLELYSQDTARRVSIDGREVPLEFETTSSLALLLEGSRIYEFERSGFRSGDLRLLGAGSRPTDGLMMLSPYRTGRIPVVLVHGTASSPARWAELINELQNDPRIWEHFQIWLFLYTTGSPVALSGAQLRRALVDVLDELDPQRQDPALQRMVVVGHSQGGLLSKLTVIDSGNRFWDGLSEVPIDELELRAETRELLERALFFDPHPVDLVAHFQAALTAIRPPERVETARGDVKYVQQPVVPPTLAALPDLFPNRHNRPRRKRTAVAR